MKTRLTNLFLSAALALTSCSPASGKDPEEHKSEDKSTVELGNIIKSSILGREVRYTVYLPAGYKDSKTSYPVLYLLHGYDFNGGNEKGDLAWVSAGSLVSTTDAAIKKGSVSEMIVIMPCGFNAFYINGFQDGMRYEDFFFNELIPHIESSYKVKTDRDSRAIAGLSMGGYGTTLYAFSHPELFCFAYSMSGAVAGNGYIKTPESVITESISKGTSADAFPYYIMEVGTEDPIPGLYDANVKFDKFLTSQGIEHKYIERHGVHDWAFWTECYRKCLIDLGKYFHITN